MASGVGIGVQPTISSDKATMATERRGRDAAWNGLTITFPEQITTPVPGHVPRVRVPRHGDVHDVMSREYLRPRPLLEAIEAYPTAPSTSSM